MPWIDVGETHAAAPRPSSVAPGEVWDGRLSVDRGWADLTDVEVVGARLDLADVETLSISGAQIVDTTFDMGSATETEAWRAVFERCDLSPFRFTSVRSCTFVGCKFVGTDLSEGRLIDVTFERCTFRYVNLRRSQLERVTFIDCQLDDVDLYDAAIEHVSVPLSRLSQINLDRVKASQVDLRGASELALTTLSRLDGFLVGEDQLPALMYSLAFSLGLGVERPPES